MSGGRAPSSYDLRIILWVARLTETDCENRTDARKQRLAIAMLTCTVFFGAALLFSMEPLVGRLLTPYFGGAAHVWLTCLMFFQAMLLLGYLYAHLFARKLGPWHLFVPSYSLGKPAFANRCQPRTQAHLLLAILETLVFYVALPLLHSQPQPWSFRHGWPNPRRDEIGNRTPFMLLQTQVRSSRFSDMLF